MTRDQARRLIVAALEDLRAERAAGRDRRAALERAMLALQRYDAAPSDYPYRKRNARP